MVAMPQLRQPPPPWPCGWAWPAFSSDWQASLSKSTTSKRQVFSGFVTSLHFTSLSSRLIRVARCNMYIYIYIYLFFLRHADKGNQQAMFQANYYKKPKFRFVADQNHKICNCAEMVSAHAYLPEHGSNFAEMNAPIVPIRTSRGQTSRRIPPKVELNYCTIAQYYGRFASLPPCVRIW
jgi:hypothetical protein